MAAEALAEREELEALEAAAGALRAEFLAEEAMKESDRYLAHPLPWLALRSFLVAPAMLCYRRMCM